MFLAFFRRSLVAALRERACLIQTGTAGTYVSEEAEDALDCSTRCNARSLRVLDQYPPSLATAKPYLKDQEHPDDFCRGPRKLRSVQDLRKSENVRTRTAALPACSRSTRLEASSSRA